MTRINAGVDPRELCDQHLIAEYRELRRVLRHTSTKSLIPTTFSLGRGHVLFFVNKGRYLHKRWELLCEEMRRRGFAVNLTWRGWPEHLYSDWMPREGDRQIVLDRIEERLGVMMPRYS